MTLMDWARHHGLLFGLLGPEDANMLREVGMHFQQSGYSLDELQGATDELARTAPPRYRSEHLAAMTATLERRRKAHLQRPEPVTEEQCPTCRGAKWVIVPKPQAIEQGRWETCAVTCSCPLGRWLYDQVQARGAVSLERYEAFFLDWREQMTQHEESLRSRRAVEGYANDLDRVLGEIGKMPRDHRRRTLQSDNDS